MLTAIALWLGVVIAAMIVAAMALLAWAIIIKPLIGKRPWKS
jgi:hypothetical protein